MKYVGVKTTGELRLHEVKEPQTDEIYMAVEDDKLGAVPIRPYEFVKWDGKQWVKVPNVQLVTTLDTVKTDEEISEISKEQSYIKQLLTNPLNLPAKTIRCKFTSGYTPTMGTSQTLVDAGDNIWDIGFTNASALFKEETNLLEVLGANTSSVTDMDAMFEKCTSLASVPLFDTSSATDMTYMFRACTSLASVPLFDTSSIQVTYGMFSGCVSLASVPLFDTSSATDMGDMFSGCVSLASVPLFDTSSATDIGGMFYDCLAVTKGALALYQQASAQNPQPMHFFTFTNCGSGTITGAAELAQIPASWGGTAAG